MASIISPGENVTITFGSAVAQVISGDLSVSPPRISTTNLDSTEAEDRANAFENVGTLSVEVFMKAAHTAVFDKINDSTSTSTTVDITEADGSNTKTATFNSKLASYSVSGFTVGENVKAKMDLDLKTIPVWT